MPQPLTLPLRRAFGIEIECADTHDGVTGLAQALARELGESLDFDDDDSDSGLVTLSNGWQVCYDGSCGCEVKSPILSGTTGLASVRRVLKAMRAIGCRVNSSCGIHIHVDFRDAAAQVKSFRNLTGLISRAEDLIFSVTDPNRRGNSFCREYPETTYRAVARATSIQDVIAAWYNPNGREYGGPSDLLRDARNNHYHGSRYHATNLHSVFFRGSVEYRYFNSTLSFPLVGAWIALCVTATEYAYRAKAIRFRDLRASRFTASARGNLRSVLPRRMSHFLKVLGKSPIMGAEALSAEAARRLVVRFNATTGANLVNPLAAPVAAESRA